MRYEAAPHSVANPAAWTQQELIPVEGPLSARLERQLGYFGDARFCYFYFDSQADGLIWNDGQNYGFGSGSWRAFAEYIEPLAPRYGVTLGNRRSQGYVLLIDRKLRTAYFADWRSARAITTGQMVPAGMQMPGRQQVMFAA